ncbi:hypothetical protein [Aureliella helgolandensis]|uniref:Phytase-like domain-containing protein n=1 Tax=Aureliella helgolandensis TaxID=2527968 RepID=A0A518GAE9_9BACT|nr:hypothetical protein [Aureliella helgolandensis]QDV25578.1 hypothetical protein Q31a_39040 [Aureliella helgolandensis]
MQSTKHSLGRFLAVVAAVSVVCSAATTEAARPGMAPGQIKIESIGPMAFAESGILLVGDPKAATVYAIELDATDSGNSQVEVADVQAAIAKAANTTSDKVKLGDLAADSTRQIVILSAEVDGAVGLFRILPDGSAQTIDTAKILHAKKVIPNAPADEETGEGRRRRNRRLESITDLAFFDGKVLVSGLTQEDSDSSVREFPFPFAENTHVTNVEIFHAAHGRVESPTIQTFVPINIAGEPSLLAGFTCTPLVRFPIDQLNGGDKVRGTTIAELGNRNRPLDLIVYMKDNASHLLMSNSARGVMKISTENLNAAPGLTEPVGGGGTAGQPFETVEAFQDVLQMDKLDATHAVLLVGKPESTQKLVTVVLP